MPEANTHRGEVDITLGGVQYVARLTHTSIASIEKELGRLLTLVERFIKKDIGFTDCFRIIYEGIKGGTHPSRVPSYDQVCEQVYELGFLKAHQMAESILAPAVAGPQTEDGSLAPKDPAPAQE